MDDRKEILNSIVRYFTRDRFVGFLGLIPPVIEIIFYWFNKPIIPNSFIPSLNERLAPFMTLEYIICLAVTTVTGAYVCRLSKKVEKAVRNDAAGEELTGYVINKKKASTVLACIFPSYLLIGVLRSGDPVSTLVLGYATRFPYIWSSIAGIISVFKSRSILQDLEAVQNGEEFIVKKTHDLPPKAYEYIFRFFAVIAIVLVFWGVGSSYGNPLVRHRSQEYVKEYLKDCGMSEYKISDIYFNSHDKTYNIGVSGPEDYQWFLFDRAGDLIGSTMKDSTYSYSQRYLRLSDIYSWTVSPMLNETLFSRHVAEWTNHRNSASALFRDEGQIGAGMKEVSDRIENDISFEYANDLAARYGEIYVNLIEDTYDKSSVSDYIDRLRSSLREKGYNYDTVEIRYFSEDGFVVLRGITRQDMELQAGDMFDKKLEEHKTRLTSDPDYADEVRILEEIYRK